MARKTNLQKIRFFGTADSLAKWRDEIRPFISHEPGEIRTTDDDRHAFEVFVTADQRQAIQDSLWTAESGTGELANGRPYQWNHCVSFEEIELEHCGKRVTVTALCDEYADNPDGELEGIMDLLDDRGYPSDAFPTHVNDMIGLEGYLVDECCHEDEWMVVLDRWPEASFAYRTEELKIG